MQHLLFSCKFLRDQLDWKCFYEEACGANQTTVILTSARVERRGHSQSMRSLHRVAVEHIPAYRDFHRVGLSYSLLPAITLLCCFSASLAPSHPQTTPPPPPPRPCHNCNFNWLNFLFSIRRIFRSRICPPSRYFRVFERLKGIK